MADLATFSATFARSVVVSHGDVFTRDDLESKWGLSRGQLLGIHLAGGCASSLGTVWARPLLAWLSPVWGVEGASAEVALSVALVALVGTLAATIILGVMWLVLLTIKFSGLWDVSWGLKLLRREVEGWVLRTVALVGQFLLNLVVLLHVLN